MLDFELVTKGQLIIGDFGVSEGVHTYRVNGLQDDLEELLTWILLSDFKFHSPPVIEETKPRSMHTILLKLVIPDSEQ